MAVEGIPASRLSSCQSTRISRGFYMIEKQDVSASGKSKDEEMDNFLVIDKRKSEFLFSMHVSILTVTKDSRISDILL